jgi:hypothetical protein
MESISANLHGFLHQIDGNMSRPDQKFLQGALIGLLRAGRPIVCQMARQLPNQRTEYTMRVKRNLGTPYRLFALAKPPQSGRITAWPD